MKTISSSLKNLVLKYSIIIVTGIVTAIATIVFKIISLFVLYHYIRFDLYLCFVAILFFIAGKYFYKNKNIADKKSAQTNVFLLLSAKELQVLTLVAEGKTNKEIAAIQFIEVSTVKTHINNIYTKLSVINRKEARARYNELKHKN